MGTSILIPRKGKLPPGFKFIIQVCFRYNSSMSQAYLSMVEACWVALFYFVFLIPVFWYSCHNPTNNPKQLKTIFVGVVLVSVRKPHHTTPPHHTGDDYNLGSSRQSRKLIFGMQSYSNQNRTHMEDDLNIFENGRQPQFFWKRKTTSILKMKEDLKNNATKSN